MPQSAPTAPSAIRPATAAHASKSAVQPILRARADGPEVKAVLAALAWLVQQPAQSQQTQRLHHA